VRILGAEKTVERHAVFARRINDKTKFRFAAGQYAIVFAVVDLSARQIFLSAVIFERFGVVAIFAPDLERIMTSGAFRTAFIGHPACVAHGQKPNRTRYYQFFHTNAPM
jgi:hypothetical protein